jgi:hypothetical protein
MWLKLCAPYPIEVLILRLDPGSRKQNRCAGKKFRIETRKTLNLRCKSKLGSLEDGTESGRKTRRK